MKISRFFTFIFCTNQKVVLQNSRVKVYISIWKLILFVKVRGWLHIIIVGIFVLFQEFTKTWNFFFHFQIFWGGEFFPINSPFHLNLFQLTIGFILSIPSFSNRIVRKESSKSYFSGRLTRIEISYNIILNYVLKIYFYLITSRKNWKCSRWWFNQTG